VIPVHFAGGLQPVHQWHADIEYRHVRAEVGNHANQFVAVRGFTHDLDAFPLEKRSQALAYEDVIIS
jgi:hypothetical protein